MTSIGRKLAVATLPTTSRSISARPPVYSRKRLTDDTTGILVGAASVIALRPATCGRARRALCVLPLNAAARRCVRPARCTAADRGHRACVPRRLAAIPILPPHRRNTGASLCATPRVSGGHQTRTARDRERAAAPDR